MRKLKYWLSLLSLLPVVAQAAATDIIPNNTFGLPGDQQRTITAQSSLIIDWILAVVGLVAVGFLIYGGFRYITSGGNEEIAEAAKKTIQNSIIGLIIVVLSYVIVAVTVNVLYGRV